MKQLEDDMCEFCRSFSKNSKTSGWCMKHRRRVRRDEKYGCFH